MKKKITALVLVVALVALLFTGMTLAYFTDTDSAVNVFTVGDVDIELTEDVGVTGVNGEDYTDEKVVGGETGATYVNIMPGNYMQKEAVVTNLENPAYVRVTVIVNNYDLINAMIESYEDKGYTEAEIEELVDQVFDGWGIVYSHNNGINEKDMRMTIPTVGDPLLRVDSTFTTYAADGSYHFSRDNWFKSSNEETWAATGYTGGYGTGFAGGYYAQHLNDYELCYTYYLAMDKGESYKLFDGLYCLPEFDQEQAAMFNGLEIEIYAAAIQQEGFADEKAAFEQLNKEYPIDVMRAAVAPPPTPVDSAAALTEALANGGDIGLTNDTAVGESVTVPAGVEANINLNDNTVNGTLYNNGDVVVSNGTINVDGRGFENSGTAELTDVVMTAGNAAEYSNVTVNGGETTYNNVDLVSAGGGIGAANGGEVTFNSGSVSVNSTSTSGRYLFYTEGEGSVITINGGEFSFDKTQNQKRAYIYAGTGTTVYVNGGTFGPASTRSGYTAGILGDGTVIITGGTFGFDPSTWVADGYVANANGDGTYTVVAQ